LALQERTYMTLQSSLTAQGVHAKLDRCVVTYLSKSYWASNPCRNFFRLEVKLIHGSTRTSGSRSRDFFFLYDIASRNDQSPVFRRFRNRNAIIVQVADARRCVRLFDAVPHVRELKERFYRKGRKKQSGDISFTSGCDIIPVRLVPVSTTCSVCNTKPFLASLEPDELTAP